MARPMPEPAPVTSATFPSNIAICALLRQGACCARRIARTSAAPGCFDGRDVDLRHFHHRFESTLGRGAIGTGDHGSEDAWRDLPRQAPLVLAPAAGAFLAAVAHDGIPQAIRLGLVVRR